jgi:hypothetical protein
VAGWNLEFGGVVADPAVHPGGRTDPAADGVDQSELAEFP